MKKRFLCFTLLMVLILSFTAAAESTLSDMDAVSARMQTMTLEEKVGQLFIIRVDALDLSQPVTQVNDAWAEGMLFLSEDMEKTLEKYPVGGVVLSGKNIADQKQLLSFTRALKNAGDIPLFIAVDEEGGLVARLANTWSLNLPQYESAMAVGASGDPKDAQDMGRTIAAYLRVYGFNMDFAPVADVFTNPQNTVIGSRAFASDAQTVTQMTRAFSDELQKKEIIPVYKHFPGHGDTAEDSHTGLAVSYKTKEEMLSCEWLPYETLSQYNCVMTAHVATPNVTGHMLPATMSPEILQDVLRKELGFTGVILTDSMDMGAITEAYTPGEAAVQCILAGCDMVLGPENLQEAYDALLSAVKNGDIPEERIDESVYRVLTLKESYGILN